MKFLAFNTTFLWSTRISHRLLMKLSLPLVNPLHTQHHISYHYFWGLYATCARAIVLSSNRVTHAPVGVRVIALVGPLCTWVQVTLFLLCFPLAENDSVGASGTVPLERVHEHLQRERKGKNMSTRNSWKTIVKGNCI